MWGWFRAPFSLHILHDATCPVSRDWVSRRASHYIYLYIFVHSEGSRFSHTPLKSTHTWRVQSRSTKNNGKILHARRLDRRWYRIIVWKRPLRSSSPTIHPITPCLLNHVLKCHIYAFFKHLQGWGLNHFPGQPVPMPDHSFRKEVFPNI